MAYIKLKFHSRQRGDTDSIVLAQQTYNALTVSELVLLFKESDRPKMSRLMRSPPYPTAAEANNHVFTTTGYQVLGRAIDKELTT